MTLLLVLIFALLALVAASFAVLPFLVVGASSRPRRWLIAPSLAGVAILLCGIGIYGLVGAPGLALRSLTGPDREDYPSLIAALARTMRDRPNDAQGWTYLGQGYLVLGQTGQAAKAYARAVAITRAQGAEVPAKLLADYAVALSIESEEVTPEAEAIFREALSIDPTNQDARYHLGFAHARRGETAAALALWEPLVTEAAPDAPWRQAMFAQLAVLKGRQGQPPNVQAMVEGLAARLKENPKDLDGWLMLIQSYGVLGQPEKGREALSAARSAFAGDAAAESALAEKARASGIE